MEKTPRRCESSAWDASTARHRGRRTTPCSWMEGLLIDTRVTMADLKKSVLRLFAASYLGRDVHIRFRRRSSRSRSRASRRISTGTDNGSSLAAPEWSIPKY